MCLRHTRGSFSIIYSEKLQFCNSKEKFNNWGDEPVVDFLAPPRYQRQERDSLHVAFTFGFLAAVFSMKLGTPVGVNFLGSGIERKQKTEQYVHQEKYFEKIVENIWVL